MSRTVDDSCWLPNRSDGTSVVTPVDRPEDPSGEDRADEDQPDREWWPLDRRDAVIMLATFIGLTACFTVIGWAIVRWWDPSSFGNADMDVNRWLSDARTASRNDLAHFGSMLSGTETMVVMATLLLPVSWLLFRRLHEWALVAFGLLLEVTIFVASSTLVGRDRPPVEQLEGAPTSSWPSGHIAAAVVFYGGIALIVIWHVRRSGPRGVAVGMLMTVPVVVIASRLYLGMHHPSDAAGGIVLGVLCLVIMGRLVRNQELRLHRASEA